MRQYVEFEGLVYATQNQHAWHAAQEKTGWIDVYDPEICSVIDSMESVTVADMIRDENVPAEVVIEDYWRAKE